MQKRISRRLKRSEESDFFSLITFILSLPVARIVDRVNALITLPGMGEDQRISDVIRYWQGPMNSATHFLIAGHNHKESTTRRINIENLQCPPFNLRVINNVCIGPFAENTKEQAEWVLKQVGKMDIRSLCLFAPAYHLPRAYLTFLKTFLKSSPKIVIIPISVSIPPDSIVPETGIDAWAMVPGEVDRIKAYQEKGDVATLEELQEYFTWLWQQPLLK